MDEIKRTIAKNIQLLRKESGITQSELAQKLNYSDKAVSKWERGESVPDIAVLKSIADLFCVTIDFLVEEVHDLPQMSQASKKIIRKNRVIISLLATTMVWLLATIGFVVMGIADAPAIAGAACYLIALPVSCVVLLVFNSIWGRTKLNYAIISALIWTVLLTVYVLLNIEKLWLIFLIGIPAQVIVLMWSNLKIVKK